MGLQYRRTLFDKWDSEMSYVLGFLFADGSVYKNPRNSSYIEFVSTDLELIKKIRNIFNSNHKIGIIVRNKKWRTSYRLQIGSKDLWKVLRDYTKGGYLYNKNRGYELVFGRYDSIALFKLMYNNVSTKMFLERKHEIFLKAIKVLNLGGVA